MIETKYSIGDTVWYARCNWIDEKATCPDCGGTGRIRCIMHDEATVSVECGACRQGYDPPTGFIRVYDYHPSVEMVVIDGVEVGKETRYRSRCYILDEDKLFPTREAAREVALQMVAAAKAAQTKKIAEKEKDSRTWAQNASYHRSCIRRAQKDLAYHTAKLNVAAIKAKGD